MYIYIYRIRWTCLEVGEGFEGPIRKCELCFRFMLRELSSCVQPSHLVAVLLSEAFRGCKCWFVRPATVRTC